MAPSRIEHLPFTVRPSVPEPSADVRAIRELLDGLLEARQRPAPRDRPFVTLSYAQSVDGSIARRRGERFSISGPESLRLTHHLRGRHDAILVGVGTVLADDPQLSVRLAEGEDPQPIVVDSSLRTPPDARLLTRTNRPLWIGTTAGDRDGDARVPTGGQSDLTAAADLHLARRPEDRHDQTQQHDKRTRGAVLAAQGAHLLTAPTLPNGWVDLAALLRTLKAKGVTHLMVEGGAQIITSFLRARLVDYAMVTVAPLFLGGVSALGGLSALGGGGGHPAARGLSGFGAGGPAPAGGDAPGLETPTGTGVAVAVPRLKNWASQRLGDDLVVAGEVHWPPP